VSRPFRLAILARFALDAMAVVSFLAIIGAIVTLIALYAALLG
jgi:hypothetical protein